MKGPVFISFVDDDNLNSRIEYFKKMRQIHGCVLAFDRKRNVIGIGFQEYDHILQDTEIIRGPSDNLLLSSVDDGDDEEVFNFGSMPLKDIERILISNPDLDEKEKFEIYYEERSKRKGK